MASAQTGMAQRLIEEATQAAAALHEELSQETSGLSGARSGQDAGKTGEGMAGAALGGGDRRNTGTMNFSLSEDLEYFVVTQEFMDKAEAVG